MTTFIQAYSPRQKRCSVDYGDDSDSEVFDDLTDPIVSLESKHQYPGLGFFAASLTCENSFGRSSETAVAVGAERGCRRENLSKGVDLVIPVAGADGSVGRVAVYVDGVAVTDGVRVNSTHVVVGQALLATTGEHTVVLKTAVGVTFFCRIITVETPISGVLLSLDNYTCAVQPNQSVEVRVTVMAGDNVFVNLSYGDGNFELVYVQSCPVTLTRRHLYSSLGEYSARLTVANAIGVQEVMRVVSVERPIRKVSMTVTSWSFVKVTCNYVKVIG